MVFWVMAYNDAIGIKVFGAPLRSLGGFHVLEGLILSFPLLGLLGFPILWLGLSVLPFLASPLVGFKFSSSSKVSFRASPTF